MVRDNDECPGVMTGGADLPDVTPSGTKKRVPNACERCVEKKKGNDFSHTHNSNAALFDR